VKSIELIGTARVASARVDGRRYARRGVFFFWLSAGWSGRLT
jgi:hypothetical protein